MRSHFFVYLVNSFILSAALAQEAKPPVAEKDVEAAQKKLVANPDDPEANLIVGMNLIIKAKWDEGLPCLAKAKDQAIKDAVAKDQASPTMKLDQLEAGDFWTTAAKKVPKYKTAFQERAIFWYAKAWVQLDDPVWKGKLRTRLHTIANFPEGWEKTPRVAGPVIKGWNLPDKYWGSYVYSGFCHTGTKSAIIGQSPKENTSGGAGFHSNPIPVIAGKSYHVTIWCFSELTDVDGNPAILWLDSTGKNFDSARLMMSMDSPWWQKIEGDFVAPATAVRLQFNFGSNAKQGAYWIDDVSVTSEGKEIFPNGSFEQN
jgi:hypothetical protein